MKYSKEFICDFLGGRRNREMLIILLDELFSK